jgi:hypothetical protein
VENDDGAKQCARYIVEMDPFLIFLLPIEI